MSSISGTLTASLLDPLQSESGQLALFLNEAALLLDQIGTAAALVRQRPEDTAHWHALAGHFQHLKVRSEATGIHLLSALAASWEMLMSAALTQDAQDRNKLLPLLGKVEGDLQAWMVQSRGQCAAQLELAEREHNCEEIPDLELLTVFLQEGRQFLSQIGTGLQQWRNTTEDVVVLQALLRTLHTFKGSARMVGAMRLAHHLHVLESDIGEIAAETEPSASQIEALLRRYDLAQQFFEALQRSHVATSEETGAASRHGVNMLSVRMDIDVLDKLHYQASEITLSQRALGAQMRLSQQALSDLAGQLLQLDAQLRAHASDLTSGELFAGLWEVDALQRKLTAALVQSKIQLRRQGRLTRGMQKELMQSRMVPLRDIEERLQLLVRQMSRETAKPLVLEVQGAGLRIERVILERMIAPLEHLLRNAAVHGIEPSVQRLAAGKDAVGKLHLEVSQQGNQVLMCLSDDGQGLALQRIREIALRNGLLTSNQVISQADLAELIFHPGFSTSSELTAVAGRGIGLDVVRAEVAALGGSIHVETQAGKGATFTVVLPLSMVLSRVLLLRVASQTYAIACAQVAQVLRLPAHQMAQVWRDNSLQWQGHTLKVHRLPDLLGSSEPMSMDDGMALVVIKSGRGGMALLTERIIGSSEVVSKKMSAQFSGLRGVSGAAVLADGSIALIVDPLQLALRQDCSEAT